MSGSVVNASHLAQSPRKQSRLLIYGFFGTVDDNSSFVGRSVAGSNPQVSNNAIPELAEPSPQSYDQKSAENPPAVWPRLRCYVDIPPRKRPRKDQANQDMNVIADNSSKNTATSRPHGLLTPASSIMEMADRPVSGPSSSGLKRQRSASPADSTFSSPSTSVRATIILSDELEVDASNHAGADEDVEFDYELDNLTDASDFQMLDANEMGSFSLPDVSFEYGGSSLYVPAGVARLLENMKRTLEMERNARSKAEDRLMEETQKRVEAEEFIAKLLLERHHISSENESFMEASVDAMATSALSATRAVFSKWADKLEGRLYEVMQAAADRSEDEVYNVLSSTLATNPAQSSISPQTGEANGDEPVRDTATEGLNSPIPQTEGS
ncbi:unnamed protein product [Somion occarium]|uniref:Uncharacterized protein n=1 Tax=Somion occarium TaxID=3059160 RepID=A0ABP1CNF6_9APHY